MGVPKSNRIKYGLRNVHFAAVTEDANSITYAPPKRLPGGVNLSLEPNGEQNPFFADDIEYFNEETNNGYDGELELANITDEFRIDVLGERLIDGVLYENAESKGKKKFALLFEFQGDVKAKRHVMYYCSANRPTISGSTKTNTKEPQTSTLTFSSRPRPTDYEVKADTAGASDAVYNNWYTKVHEPPAVTVTVDPAVASVGAGSTQQLTATVTGTTDTSVIWTTADETVATVDSTGLVTVDASSTAGETVVITATSVADTNKSASAIITVATV